MSALIYSLRTNSWRYLGDLAEGFELDENKCYIFLHGCRYWLGTVPLYEDVELSLSFDMTTEAFQDIDVPEYYQPAFKCLGVYHESIAFLSVHKTEKVFDIWTCNEGDWTKKFMMGPNLEIKRPIRYWQKSKFVLH